jgi:solute carrier family 25 phosphate transporter 23/24/25/41
MINGESPNAQDARVEELWRRLGGDGKGYLDLAGLKKGLRKMDHRTLCNVAYVLLQVSEAHPRPALKNATTLLRDVLEAIDTNHDGRVSYTG